MVFQLITSIFLIILGITLVVIAQKMKRHYNN